jgi:hypothetical protein
MLFNTTEVLEIVIILVVLFFIFIHYVTLDNQLNFIDYVVKKNKSNKI